MKKIRNVCMCLLLGTTLFLQPIFVQATEGEAVATEGNEAAAAEEAAAAQAEEDARKAEEEAQRKAAEEAAREEAKKAADEKVRQAGEQKRAAEEANRNITKQMEDAASSLSNKQNESNAAKNRLDNINNEANQISGNITSLNRSLAGVASEISTAESSIAQAEDDIERLNEELEQAKKDEQRTYDVLKRRIAFSYENDSKMNLFVTLLSSQSITDFFTRVEYASSVLKYEQQLMEDCRTKQAAIQEKAEALAAKQEELSSYKESLSAKKDEMKSLVANANESLDAKKGEAANAAEDVAAYEAELQNLRQTYQNLQGQQAQAQANLAQAIAAQEEAERERLALEQGVEAAAVEIPRENTAGAISASEYEMLFLAATIQAEADNQGYVGQMAVGSVIMNRVNSTKFPNSIVAVITAPGQFASYSSGMVDRIMERGPNESCKQAAQAVISGQRSGDWLFFMTQYYADSFGITGYTPIGDHVFFYKWGAN